MPANSLDSVLIVDRSPLFCEGVRASLVRKNSFPFQHSYNQQDLAQALAKFCPQLFLIGPDWTTIETFNLCRLIRKRTSTSTILIISNFADQFEFQVDAAYSGANACLSISTDARALANALESIGRNAVLFSLKVLEEAYHSPSLTDRELEILINLNSGKSNHETAKRLSLSEHTVSAHLRNIFRKLGVHSRDAAFSRARLRGWIS